MAQEGETAEIKVTSEMRLAGAIALDAALGSLSQEETAEAVYIAMASLDTPPNRLRAEEA